jgi:hypothetical protein
VDESRNGATQVQQRTHLHRRQCFDHIYLSLQVI